MQGRAPAQDIIFSRYLRAISRKRLSLDRCECTCLEAPQIRALQTWCCPVRMCSYTTARLTNITGHQGRPQPIRRLQMPSQHASSIAIPHIFINARSLSSKLWSCRCLRGVVGLTVGLGSSLSIIPFQAWELRLLRRLCGSIALEEEVDRVRLQKNRTRQPAPLTGLARQDLARAHWNPDWLRCFPTTSLRQPQAWHLHLASAVLLRSTQSAHAIRPDPLDLDPAEFARKLPAVRQKPTVQH